MGHFYRTVLRGTWTQLHPKLAWWGHSAIIPTQKVCFNVPMFCCIFKRGRLKIDWCWKRRQVSHFLTPPWIIREGCGWSLYQLLRLYLYDWTSGIHLMAIQCAAAERGVLIKNAERKKEKKVHGQNLRPFRLTSGGLINIGIPGIVTCNKRRRRRAVWR